MEQGRRRARTDLDLEKCREGVEAIKLLSSLAVGEAVKMPESAPSDLQGHHNVLHIGSKEVMREKLPTAITLRKSLRRTKRLGRKMETMQEELEQV
jgi:hypothetical protein